jgi:hypothetical protein
MRPDDIPQDVWDAAKVVCVEIGVGDDIKGKDCLTIARAILAERQSLSAQLAAEKARADKAEGERDALTNFGAPDVGVNCEAAERAGLPGTARMLRALLGKWQSAEANLAAANKQIEEMREDTIHLALEEVIVVRSQLGMAGGIGIAGEANAQVERNVVGPWLDLVYDGISSLRTALSHEAHNG